MSAPFTIEVCTTADQVEDVFRIREQVFVKDYGYDKDALVDEVVDSNALQILARDSNGVAVGSCRFTPLPQDLDTLNYNTKPTTDIVQELFKVAEGSRLWWLAVLSTTRGKGLASQIIKFCEDYTGNAVKQRSRSVYVRLRANYKAHTMYSHLGYSQDSDIFWIDEQQLVWMRKIWKIQD